MSRTADWIRHLVEPDREAWELGRKFLAELERRLGPELVAALVGAWLGRHHRERPRLQWFRPDSPARAPHYLAFVRELPCARCGAPPTGVIDPHHFGPRGVGQKCDDYRTIPLCRPCHLTAHRLGWGRGWQDSVQLATLVLYLRVVEQT